MTEKRMGPLPALWLLMRNAMGGGGKYPWLLLLGCCISMSMLAVSDWPSNRMGPSLFFPYLLWYGWCVHYLMKIADNKVLLILPLSRRDRLRIKWICIFLLPGLVAMAMYPTAAAKILMLGAQSEILRYTTSLYLRLVALTGAAFCWSRLAPYEMMDREGRKGSAHVPGLECALVSMPLLAGVFFWSHLSSVLQVLTVGAGVCSFLLPSAIERWKRNRSPLHRHARSREGADRPTSPGLRRFVHFYMLPTLFGSGAALIFLIATSYLGAGQVENLMPYPAVALLVLGVGVHAQHTLRVYRPLPLSSWALAARFATIHGAMYASFAIVLLVIGLSVPAFDADAILHVLHIVPLIFGAGLLMTAALIGLPVQAISTFLVVTVFAGIILRRSTRLGDLVVSINLTWFASAVAGSVLALLGTLGMYLVVSRSSRPYRRGVRQE